MFQVQVVPIVVKTVEGISELQIPPGTQPGDVLILARKDAPKLNKPSICGCYQFASAFCLQSMEHELLEEVSLLRDTTSSHSKSCLKTRSSTERSPEGPAAQNVESTVATVAEQTAQLEDHYDLWKKLKDIAG
ncbi:hypothetical protein GLYMA_07G029400v4 [Glycine max]|uniref:Uncharacterized protein n=1 Tax=Glycine max TaxID=3847 RepID=A0A0R0IYS0_SOYBN|nr:hypothetical protein GYH30_017235 [Glycine max]KRH47431.1 hypothetical protein GLYMA_07G029400v4 [Glycine max]